MGVHGRRRLNAPTEADKRIPRAERYRLKYVVSRLERRGIYGKTRFTEQVRGEVRGLERFGNRMGRVEKALQYVSRLSE